MQARPYCKAILFVYIKSLQHWQLSVKQITQTGLRTLSITHSPKLGAPEIVSDEVKDINTYFGIDVTLVKNCLIRHQVILVSHFSRYSHRPHI